MKRFACAQDPGCGLGRAATVRNRLRLLLWVSLSTLACAIPSSNLWGQSSTTGGLRGAVTDANGAPVAGAVVTLFNGTTRQAQVAVTDGNGLYGFSLLAPGSYEVVFARQGFKTATATSVAVNVSEAPELDAQLEPGAGDERVACKCRLSQAATSSSGTLVDSKTITAVPLTTRNLTQVLSMSSGSAANVNNAGLLGAGTLPVNVNGDISAGLVTFDGAAAASTVPNPDTITEFKIQTSQYDAGYGVKVPNINLISRLGQNDFHGDLWEFVRNDIFNANSFFQNANGRPKATLKQNQFGGTLGGPVKKDKLLFFVSYQGTRQANGLDPTASIDSVVLPPLTNDRSAATIGAEFCPANKPANVKSAYMTFAGGAQVACDGSNINPVALKILQTKLPDGSYLIPTPQTIIPSGANAGLGLSAFSLESTYDENQWMGNLSYVLSKKHTFTARFYAATAATDRAFGSAFLRAPETPPTPGFPVLSHDINYIGVLQLTSTITSSISNEARMTYTELRSDPTEPGLPSTTSLGMTPANPESPLLPDIIMRGSLGGFQAGNVLSDFLNHSKYYSWSDTLSWSHGRQTTRAGFFAYTQPIESSNMGLARGQLSFNNFTDFLLGMNAAQNGSPQGLSNVQSIAANEGMGPGGTVLLQLRLNNFAGFVQNDIKVNGRLTINPGLRWEYLPGSYGRPGNLGNIYPSLLQTVPIPPVSGTYVGLTVPSNYDPNLINPYTGQPFGPPPPGVVVRPNSGWYNSARPWRTFAPRFGFAWQPGSKQTRLAVRGGYGWFYEPLSSRGNANGTPSENMQPLAELIGAAGASNGASTLQAPFPPATLGFIPRTPSSHLDDRAIGPDYRPGRLQEWNLNVQYAFSSNLSLDIGYVGSHGNNLFMLYASNQPLLAAPGQPVNCGLPTSAGALGVTPAVFANLGLDSSGCITTSTSLNAFLRVPIVGETPSGLLAHEYVGGSWYHSAQATLRERLSHGLNFQFAYTFSKAEANTTAYNDQNNLNLDWGPTSFDRRHRVITNFNYDIPGLQRRRYLGAASQGWSISGIVIVQSGLPMTLTDKTGGAVYGFAGTATATICPGQTYADLLTPGSLSSRLHNWFNKPALCSAPVLGSDGSTGYGNTGVGILAGPGQFNTDVSIGKITTVGGLRENGQLAFRAEFYNALNHPQFANPGTNFGTANFGVITQTSVAPRLIQFGLKYLF
ncbi:MAG TPA: TonB-dependent receptor [Candidatus Acidoferrales bacterium]|nr:TonB-dependent receptor [Candidatus Acidoferrales bacterium]